MVLKVGQLQEGTHQKTHVPVKGSINTRPTPRANMEEDAHAPGASGDTATEATPTPAAVDAGNGTNVEHAEPSQPGGEPSQSPFEMCMIIPLVVITES